MRKLLFIFACCLPCFAAAALSSTETIEKDHAVEKNPYSETVGQNIEAQAPGAEDEKIVYQDKKSGDKIIVHLTRYEPQLYLLAYNTFLMSGEPSYAFKLAKVAVRHEPQNIEWRKRLAQTSLWTGNAIVALNQWMYFINHQIEPQLYIPKALALAGQLRDYDIQAALLRKLLKVSPGDNALFLKYVKSVQSQGFPLKALNILKKIPAVKKKPHYLQQMAAIANSLDEPELEYHYLSLLSPLQENDLLTQVKQAEILYSKGDLQAAFNHYHQAASEVALNNHEFWKSYGSISLLTGHRDTAVLAYKKLLQGHQIDKFHLLLLSDLEEELDMKEMAYAHAKLGFERFHDLQFMKLMLGLESELRRSDELLKYLAGLSAKQMGALENDPNYAPVIANLYWQAGDRLKGWQAWQALLKRWPDNTRIQTEFLWMLVDNNLYQQMEFVLHRWNDILEKKAALWNIYSAMLTALGYYPQALWLMKQHWRQVNNQYSLLLNIADLFTQNNHPFAAYYSQRKAFYLLLNEMMVIKKTPSLSQQLALSELTRRFASAETTYRILIHLSKQLFSEVSVDEQLIAWALEQQRYSIARQMIRRRTLSGKETPPWMMLTLALEENDRQQMQTLLQKAPKQLPYRDRVRAAMATGNFKRAEEYAYQGLKEHPDDNEMHRLFIDTMLLRANKIYIEQMQQGYGNVVGPLTKLNGRFYLTPSLAFKPFAKAWFPHTTDAAVFAPTPSLVRNTGVCLRKTIEQGWLEGGISVMRGLASVVPLTARWHRNEVIRGMSLELGFAYHDEADESSAMLVGGMKNDASMKVNYSYDSYNLFDAEAHVLHFAGQDSWTLGRGEEFRAHWQHKFYLSSPDWNINFYGSWLNYKSKERPLPLLLQQLIPADQTPSVSFYMPISNVEGGVTLGFNQKYREDYTRDWKLFAEGGLFYSKAFKLGKIIQGGASTSIFGRDHLVLFAEYSVNQQQVSQAQINQSTSGQVYYIIGMSYEHYF
ncbi:tetratricopeptide repeat protein [Legionella israelensis]|nr:tetratricopeptide repeat protein [Legionella israelensis]